jgi:hypothetical protein
MSSENHDRMSLLRCHDGRAFLFLEAMFRKTEAFCVSFPNQFQHSRWLFRLKNGIPRSVSYRDRRWTVADESPSCGSYVFQDIGTTMYPSGLCRVIASFSRFSREIPGRRVQSPIKSRDIVLRLPQTLPEARSRSLNRFQ